MGLFFLSEIPGNTQTLQTASAVDLAHADLTQTAEMSCNLRREQKYHATGSTNPAHKSLVYLNVLPLNSSQAAHAGFYSMAVPLTIKCL